MHWGFDLRLRDEWVNNAQTLQSDLPGSESHYLRIRPRVWTVFNPMEHAELNLRLISEPRYYFRPASQDGWLMEEGLFDVFNLRLTNFFHQPVGLTVGRQEIALGNRWLIWDGSTTDGTRSEFFDAARLTYQVAEIQTRFDAIYIFQYSDLSYWLPAIHDTQRGITEQDEQAGVFYVSNHSLKHTELDAFVVFRDQTRILPRGNEGEMWVFGARAAGNFSPRWQYRAETAFDRGDLNGRPLEGWGFNSLVSYLAGGEWKHKIRGSYEYLSGDDPDTAEDEGWDPLWARRAQYSELMVQLFSAENRGRVGDYKNLWRVGLGWTGTPAKWLEISADYMPIFANENPLAGRPGYTTSGKFRGHYAQTIWRFTFNQHFSGHVWSEFFVPGDYYSPNRQDLATFLRVELMYKF